MERGGRRGGPQRPPIRVAQLSVEQRQHRRPIIEIARVGKTGEIPQRLNRPEHRVMITRQGVNVQRLRTVADHDCRNVRTAEDRAGRRIGGAAAAAGGTRGGQSPEVGIVLVGVNLWVIWKTA